MTVGVAEIAERALRRLGVAVVPVASRPALNTRVAPDAIATGALIELGVIAADQVPRTQAVIVLSDTIATNALIKLGVIASDETPSTTDMALARSAVDAVHNSLVAQGSVNWTSVQITTAVAEEYAGLAAMHLASSFGKAGDPALVPMLEGRIATVSRVMRAMALAQSKLTQVQASLVSQAIVTWDNTGIPTAVAEEYTRLTAMALASSFGKQADPQMLPLLEGRIRKFQIVLDAPGAAENAVQDIHNDLSMRGLVRWSVFDIPDSAADAYEQLAANQIAQLFGMQDDEKAGRVAEVQLARMIALPTTGEPVRAVYF